MVPKRKTYLWAGKAGAEENKFTVRVLDEKATLAELLRHTERNWKRRRQY